MLNDSVTATRAITDEERKAIQEQLERLLSNSHFSQSRRFPSFLRFVIDQTLLGQTDLLKERTLGIEIFGREADYDTASDPIVRVTATEIRKRIRSIIRSRVTKPSCASRFPPARMSLSSTGHRKRGTAASLKQHLPLPHPPQFPPNF